MADLNFSDATIQALNQAKQDHDAAQAAQAGTVDAQNALQSAQNSFNQAQQGVTDANNKALESYRAALTALAGELGQQLPPPAQQALRAFKK